MGQQEDHVGNSNQLVTTNTYDWLQYQEEEERRSHSAHSSFISMNTLGRWTSRLWHDHGVGALPQDVGGEAYEIQYCVFKPLRGYTTLPPLPDREVLQQNFQYIVSECVDALTRYHIELRRIKAGSSGSYFVYGSVDSTPLGVFKPKDEEPYGPLSPKWTKWAHRTFFPCFFGRSCLIPNLGYICESAASLLDQRLATNLVPHTDTVVLMSTSFYDTRQAWFSMEARKQKKIGSFQLFLKDYVGAGEFFNKHPLPGMFRERITSSNENDFHWNEQTLSKFRSELEKLIILDYIMRNTDRGLDNWMVHTKKLPDGSWDIKLAAIDNALTFPWKHPDEWRSFPYGWLYLPVNILAQPFSEQTRRHFLPLLTNVKWWEQSYMEFTELFSRDSEFKMRMWKKQWSVLKGQAFNVIETIKNPRQGPLELVRRTRTLVIDETMEIPSTTLPLAILHSAMQEPIPFSASSPMVLSSVPEDRAIDLGSDSNLADVNVQSGEEVNALEQGYKTKKVVIERLMLVNSKPPVFTWW
ncbi:LAFE_0C10990g1_1 [Lachancea fermentati]|uniref:Phosphatidylinositol 4-kinase n=1 Tax=Lachancea fermentati TaxID=4955 RepID=A0A1G4MAF9_LACFM|nr:LAFE_0C10990g1_1 [Lachancea fermentati]